MLYEDRVHNMNMGCVSQSLAQQALMGTINSSMQAVQQAQADLGHVDNLPPLGHDLVSSHSSSLRLPYTVLGVNLQ